MTSEEIRQQVDSYVVKKSPKDSSLENVLSTYTKDQLSAIIDAKDLSIAKSKRKAEVIEELAEAIVHTLEESSSVTDKEAFATLSNRILPNLPVQLEDAEWTKDEAKHLETFVSEGIALVTPEEIYVADEVASKLNNVEAPAAKDDSAAKQPAKTEKKAETAPATSTADEKKVVYKSQAAKVVDLKEQKKQRQKFLKKMAKKKKGKKKK